MGKMQVHWGVRRSGGMVYTFDSKSNAARLEGSSPSSGTKQATAAQPLKGCPHLHFDCKHSQTSKRSRPLSSAGTLLFRTPARFALRLHLLTGRALAPMGRVEECGNGTASGTTPIGCGTTALRTNTSGNMSHDILHTFSIIQHMRNSYTVRLRLRVAFVPLEHTIRTVS